MGPIIADRRCATCAVLILAAGGSRRLGRPKQLVRLGGRSLLRRAASRALELDPAWVGVVLGAQATRAAVELRGLRVTAIPALDWRRGLAASLRAGMRRVPATATHVLLIALDQWAVSSGDLARLLAQRGRVPVAARYEGILGVPALFPRRWWRALARLDGDRGARALLRASHAIGVNLPSAAEDLDTPAALNRLRRIPRRELNIK